MKRLRSALAASAGLALAVSLQTPASAFVVGGGGPNPCLGITGSLELSAKKIYPGLDVTATWSTSRPAGCGTVSELTGPNGYSAFGGMGGTATFLPPSLGTWTYSVFADFPGGSVTVASATLTVTNTPHVPAVAYATPAGTVNEANDNTDPWVSQVPGVTVASGTSPVVASDLDSGVRQIAVHAADTNTLKYVNFLNQVVDTGVTMAAGSSPAMSTFGRGSADIAFAGSDTFVRLVDVDSGAVTQLPQLTGASPGTNPAVVGHTVAWHTNGRDTLWYVDEDGNPHDTGLKMAPGSSPAIATGLPDTVILFVRDTGFPAVYDTTTRTVRDYPREAVAPNTGLAIQVIVNSNCGYEFTFVGADDHALWRGFSCADPGSTHIPVAAGTGPSMAALSSTFPSGFQVLVDNPATGTIWQYFGDGNQIDTGAPIEAGTTPSTSNTTESPSTATLFNR